jgi:predicted MFS family arabinose efflux permease
VSVTPDPSASPAAPAGASSSGAGGGLDGDQLRKGYVVLAGTTFAMSIAMSVTQAIQPNFFRDEIGMDGSLNGYLIAIREVPGFLLIFVAALLLRLGMARATAFALAMAGVGWVLFAMTGSFPSLILPTLISSIGYHSWLQLQPALGLSLAAKGQEGETLGRVNSIGFAGSLIAMVTVLVSLLAVEHWSGDLRTHQGPALRGWFIASGVAAVVGALLVLRFPVSADDRAMAKAAPRITWRKEYRLYYLLSFLDGSRMQIYFAFAPFVLVEQFKVDARSMTILLIVAAVVNWRTGKLIGRMVDRHGEQRVLTIGYVLHGLTFLGFAFAPNVWFAYFFYLLYNWLFLFSIGTTTYLRKICRREDLAPSLAMGVSLAHLTAIVVPIFGAALWDRLGYQFPFLFGTVFVALSLYFTQRIERSKKELEGFRT